ncbi:Conserved_hypothetical protein [Hexamita inflata]|uniref:Uncharacterized protein n=1 Tax=Hexamita inflata TaxID=28002 RepID=A0AA86TPF6_9EUKA|nr:Conserved hypothetical protein [Hexamita inflata]
MKRTVDIIENSICMITTNTKFTDKGSVDAYVFEADDVTIEQVDKVPMCAVSIKMVNCSLCSCKSLDFHQTLTHLDLSSNYLEHVSGLENISGLEYADLSNNFITDISVLAGKNKLNVLKISNNMLFSLEIVSSLPSLLELDYTNNHVQSLKPVITHSNFKPSWVSLQKSVSLEQCMQILGLTEEEATLVFNEAKNNKIWEYIVKMLLKLRDQIKIYDEQVSLSINDNQQLTSLIFIQYFNITCLKLNRCHNVNFTEGSLKLKHLFLSNSKLLSLQGIQNFKQLETLVLRNNGLNRLPDELSLISELTNLRSINIAQNGLEDLSCLKLNQLESLNVSENRVKDISALAEFKNMKNLDISFNLVESVETLRDLVQIEQLNISHNKITNINCLNQLEKLLYFNITCNRIISVDICLVMKLLVDLRTDQNVICDIDKLTKHQNNTASWVTSQDDPTDTEIKQYFNCDEVEVQRKKIILVNQKQQSIYNLQVSLRYKSNLIEKYQNQFKTHKITVQNVSETIQDQIWRKVRDCDSDWKGNNYLLRCTQENIQTVLNQIKAIDPNLKTTHEPFRSLTISEDNELEELGFVKEFNLLKLCVQTNCKNVKLTEKVNVKIFSIVFCELENLEGIQNWTELRELYLYTNNLKNIEQLKNLNNLTVLNLGSNLIQNLETLIKLVNLTSLLLNTNKIDNIAPLRELTNLIVLVLGRNQIQNLEPLKGLTNLKDLDLQYNLIIELNSLKQLVNLTSLTLYTNKIDNIKPLRELVNLIELDIGVNFIKDFSPIQNHPNFAEYLIDMQE